MHKLITCLELDMAKILLPDLDLILKLRQLSPKKKIIEHHERREAIEEIEKIDPKDNKKKDLKVSKEPKKVNNENKEDNQGSQESKGSQDSQDSQENKDSQENLGNKKMLEKDRIEKEVTDKDKNDINRLHLYSYLIILFRQLSLS